MGATNYQFVPLNDQNLYELIPLYKKIFGVHYSIEQIRKKYQPDYTGIHAQGHFAFLNGRAVAFHGAIPMIMTYRGKKELCAQYGDAMTLKEHTGNGLFTKLGELTDGLLQESNVRFVWGFPNQNSEYGYVNKLHWKGEKRMQCYILPLKKVSSEVIMRKSKLLETGNQKRIKKLLESIIVEKKQLHSVDTKNAGGIERSNAFYRYKSFSPNYMISIEGVKVWVKPKGGLLIGDVQLENEESFLATVKNLKELANRLGLHKIVFQADPETELNRLLAKHYDAIQSWLIGYKNFDSDFPLEKLQFTYGDLDTF